MYFALILLTLFFIIFVQSGRTKFGKYCINDTQCNPGEWCIPDMAGLLLCQQILEQMPTPSMDLESKQIICQNDAQCRALGKCIPLGWPGSCQYGSLGWKMSDRCYNDADCAHHLHCVDKNGLMTCQVISGMLPYKTCQKDADCNILQFCLFSKQYDTNLCVTRPEYQTAKIGPFWNKNIEGDVIPSGLIGDGVISKDFEKQCTADYQCSVSEICAEKIIPGNRTCIYNPTANNRRCRFNADCQSGQRCEKILENLYLCRAAKQTTFMQPCNYDYECSDSQRCISIGNDVSFQNFRYCLLSDEGPSCEDDMDCTDVKVCKVSGKFKQCVPVISSSQFMPYISIELKNRSTFFYF